MSIVSGPSATSAPRTTTSRAWLRRLEEQPRTLRTALPGVDRPRAGRLPIRTSSSIGSSRHRHARRGTCYRWAGATTAQHSRRRKENFPAAGRDLLLRCRTCGSVCSAGCGCSATARAGPGTTQAAGPAGRVAADPDRTVSADRLADLLWGDRPRPRSAPRCTATWRGAPGAGAGPECESAPGGPPDRRDRLPVGTGRSPLDAAPFRSSRCEQPLRRCS